MRLPRDHLIVTCWMRGDPMPAPMSGPAYQLYVGIDIAATTFTAAWLRPTEAPSAAAS